jgi:hypothetical protein
MPNIAEYMAHVDDVLQLIRDASGADAYRCEYAKVTRGVYEIRVYKKDNAFTLDGSMVTPVFPVRIHVRPQNRCVGFLCSPLTQADNDEKCYPMNIEVPIGNLPCLTDFLLLHLSFGCAVARNMLYMTRAMPPMPQTNISVDIVPGVGFMFKLSGAANGAAILKINPDMSVFLRYEDKVIELPKIKPPGALQHAKACCSTRKRVSVRASVLQCAQACFSR